MLLFDEELDGREMLLALVETWRGFAAGAGLDELVEFLWMLNTPPVPPNLSLTAPK